MASKISLKALITSLVRSFSTAQNALSWEQLRALSAYCHKDGSLKKFTLEVPDNDQEQGDDDNTEDSVKTKSDKNSRVYEAPLLGLIPPHPLSIESATLKLTVNITDLNTSDLTEIPAEEFYDDPFGKDFTGNMKESSRPVVDIEVDTISGLEKAGRLEISLKVKSAMNDTDGYQRLLTYLSQSQELKPKKKAKDHD